MLEIALVPNQHDGHVAVAILTRFFQPPRQMGKRFAPANWFSALYLHMLDGKFYRVMS